MAKSLPKTPKYRRRLLAVGLALLWGLLISLAQVAGAFLNFDQPLLDLRQSMPTEVPLTEADLALVEINEIPATRGWPWPRLDYAILLRSLLPYNPQGVVFEMLLHDRDTQYSAFDNRFAGTVQNMNEVVFAAAGLSQPEDQPRPGNLDAIPAVDVDPHDMAQFHSLLWPLPAFAQDSRVGLNNLLAPASLQPRRVPLVFLYKDEIVPSLALQAAASRLNVSWALSEVIMGDAIYMRDGNGVLQRTVPIDSEGRLIMRYRPNYPAPWTAAFDNVPLYARTAETGGEPEQNLREVNDKLVFVGRTDAPTFEAIPGVLPATSNVQVQMLATRNILNADYIYHLPGWLIVPVYLLVAALAGLFFFYYGPGPGFVLLGILFWSWWETAILAFRGYSFEMPMVSFTVLLLGLIPISFAAAHWGMRPVTRNPPRPAQPSQDPKPRETPEPETGAFPSYVPPEPVEVQQLGMGFAVEKTAHQPEAAPAAQEPQVASLPLEGQANPAPEPEPPIEEVPEPDPDDFEKALARLAKIHEHIEKEEQAEWARQERRRQEKEIRDAREKINAERRKRVEERRQREEKHEETTPIDPAQQAEREAQRRAERQAKREEEREAARRRVEDRRLALEKPSENTSKGKTPSPSEDAGKDDANSQKPASGKESPASPEEKKTTSPPSLSPKPSPQKTGESGPPVKPQSVKEKPQAEEPAKPVPVQKTKTESNPQDD